MKKFRLVSLLTTGLLTGGILLSGCSSSDVDPHTVVGTELYGTDGHDIGTVVGAEENHTFPNGVTEPGVKLDFGTDENGESIGQSWLPQRSADTLSTSQ